MSRTATISPQRRSAAGFTLAEMLVALALFGMISALLAAVINLIARLDGSSRRQGEMMEQVATVQELLRAHRAAAPASRSARRWRYDRDGGAAR